MMWFVCFVCSWSVLGKHNSQTNACVMEVMMSVEPTATDILSLMDVWETV